MVTLWFSSGQALKPHGGELMDAQIEQHEFDKMVENLRRRAGAA